MAVSPALVILGRDMRIANVVRDLERDIDNRLLENDVCKFWLAALSKEFDLLDRTLKLKAIEALVSLYEKADWFVTYDVTQWTLKLSPRHMEQNPQ